MQISSRQYPYPVLGKGLNYYKEGFFENELFVDHNGYQVQLNFKCKIKNIEILDLLAKKKVVIVHHLECSKTCYRRAFRTYDLSYEIIESENKLSENVEVVTMIIANEKIDDFTSRYFDDDIKNMKFSIRKGYPLAIGNQYKVYIEKNRSDFNKSSSIFSIQRNIDKSISTNQVEFFKEKIVVKMPDNTFHYYKNIASNISYQSTIHSIVILPVLIYILDYIKATADKDSLENLRWYKSLKITLKKFKVDLDNGKDNYDSYDLAQKLLDSPIVKSIDFLFSSGGDDE